LDLEGACNKWKATTEEMQTSKDTENKIVMNQHTTRNKKTKRS